MSDFYDSIVPPMQISPMGAAPAPAAFGDPQATLAAAINAPPPNVQMPQRPAPDTSQIPALALLSLASSLTSRRPYGQSATNQILDGISQAASYAMSAKKEAEDRANARFSQDLQAAQVKSNLVSQAQQQQKAQIDAAVAKTTAPLQVEQLQTAILTSKDEQQLKAISVRMAKVTETYQSQMEQAKLDSMAAKTADDKAQAETRYTLAEAAMKTAQAHQQTADAQLQRVQMEKDALEIGKKQGNFKVQQGLPGEVGTFTYQKSDGNVLTGEMPMDQAAAVKKATDDFKVLDKASQLPPGTDQKTWITARMQQLTHPPSYQAAVADMQARNGTPAASPTAPTAPSAAAPPSGTPPATGGSLNPDQQAAVQYSQKNPGSAVHWQGKDGVQAWYIGGKEVSQQEAESRRSGGASPGANNTGDLSKATEAQLWAAVSGKDALQKQFAVAELQKRGLLAPGGGAAAPSGGMGGMTFGPQ